MKETVLMKEVWIPSHSQFRFTEEVDPHKGAKKFILKGMILPFEKISRNNVLYNKGSIEAMHKHLEGRPVMYNHKIDDDSLPVGHFTKSFLGDDGWYYEADIDPDERDMIRKLERGDLRHTSIQVMGGKVIERQAADGDTYTEAFISDVIEGSIVPAPGFLDTTASFAEAFKTKKEYYEVGTKVKVTGGTHKGKTGKVVGAAPSDDYEIVQVPGYKGYIEVDYLQPIESEAYTVEQDGKEIGTIKKPTDMFDLPDFDPFGTRVKLFDDSGKLVFDSAKGGKLENMELDDEEMTMYNKEEGNVPGVRDGTGPGKDSPECPYNKEDMTTGTADGAIAPTQPLDKKEEGKAPEGFVFVDWEDAQGKKWKDTIPKSGLQDLTAQIVAKGGRVLKVQEKCKSESYFEKCAGRIIKEVGEDAVKQALKDYF